jgi:cellulose synthase/poly-beta-1,6-N-acetylglucosamine synthase-like glycosyltransferase
MVSLLEIKNIIYLGIFLGLYFSSFILITFLTNKKKVFPKAEKEFSPKISLIIPCYNEAENIERTLNSIISLNYPKDKLEVLVIDDGSKDNTFSVAEKFAKSHKEINIKVYRKENGGKHTALNFGIERSVFPFIGTIDADSYLHPLSVRKMVQYFKDPQVKAVTSTVKIDKASNILEGIQYVEYIIGAFLRKVLSFLDSINVVPGPLSIFKREVFDKQGSFKEAYKTEDLEIALRMQRDNLRIAHAIDAIVYTRPCSDFKSLFKQRLRWRRGFLLNLLDYKDLLDIRKHGNLSFLLFYTLLANSVSVFLTSYSLWKIINSLADALGKFSLINFDLYSSANLHISLIETWNNFNPQPYFFLSLLSLMFIVVYFIYSKKLTLERKAPKKEFFFYIALYIFLSAIWWVSAVGAAVFKRDISWK